MGGMVVVVAAAVVLQALQEAIEHLLGDLTPSSLQVRKSGEAEIGVEVVSHRVEGSADGEGVRCAAELQLCRCSQGVLWHLRLLDVHLHHVALRALGRRSECGAWSRAGGTPAAALRLPASKWRLPDCHIPGFPDDAHRKAARWLVNEKGDVRMVAGD
ncbi:hypothetical protein GWK47_043055 [Chionoecetes opilio]|uniref:Uncharacterized protein n=1 Tax=Chionoecetes opilio TaxID=41210 RepID=A0A8J5CZT5_CHIOP|nr:hypothetical protein GWK47_043055 [Chionoecetes opilio]